MNQNDEEFTVVSRSDFIRQARDNCSKNLTPLNYSRRTEENKLHGIPAYKRMLVRGILALLILLTVIALDKIDSQFNTGNSSHIEKWITSNQGIEDAQDFFVAIYEKLAEE